ncbi:DUF2794 domain-containing protein, partial [Brucella oryzae]
MATSSAANEYLSSPSPSSASTKVIPLDRARSAPVRFNRHELGKIMNIYGRMDASGTWSDYAIDHL